MCQGWPKTSDFPASKCWDYRIIKNCWGLQGFVLGKSPCHLSSIFSPNQTFSSVRTINVFLSQAWKGLGAGVASFTKQWQFGGKQLWTVFSRPALGHRRHRAQNPEPILDRSEMDRIGIHESPGPISQSLNQWLCIILTEFYCWKFNAFLSFPVYKD